MHILVAQINPRVGDLKGNTELIIQRIRQGKSQKADLVVFPELALSGYPPEDFVLLPHFMEAVSNHLHEIIQASDGIGVIVGLPRYNPQKHEKGLYNSAALIQNQKLIDYVDKILLPTYDVFDERRYFEPGEQVKIWNFNGFKIACTICEDIWQHSGLFQTIYKRDPIIEFKEKKPDLMINISASPYSINKFNSRSKICINAARSLGCPIILCNQVGGNDSLIFDGYSLFADPRGLLQCAKGFEEDYMSIDLLQSQEVLQIKVNPIGDLYKALVLGLRDYFKKLGFKKACLGLSGGVDSAVVACLAADALGKAQVLTLGMPSRYSASESVRDAKLLAEKLGVDYQQVPIEGPFESYLSLLKPFFEEKETDITEENIQARIRGMILMAFSNKFGYLVLGTGNKSELAMGYSTLYGDMCGGLAVIGDLTKNQVYALARWINRHEEIIPWYTIERPPTAELRPNQKDSDTLPDYAIVDQVLQSYVEEHQSPASIAEHFHFPLQLVENLVKKIHLNEYKRRQSPPSLRVSEKAFSIGRKFPIVQGWV